MDAGAARHPDKLPRKSTLAPLILGDRVVFNVKGNDYRLVVAIRYEQGIMYVRFIGTHREYDRIDVTMV
jgi:mRNA interferase HigB